MVLLICTFSLDTEVETNCAKIIIILFRYKSAEQKDDKHAIESAASTLYGYLQQMENLRSRFHP